MNAEKFIEMVKSANGTPEKLFKIGKIDPDHESGDAKIVFDGETTVSGKTYKSIGYTPVADDKVLLAKVAETYLILGKIGSEG